MHDVKTAVSQSQYFKDSNISTGGVILGCYIGNDAGTSAFIDKKVRSWSQGLEGVLEAGSKDPRGLYTAVTKSILHTPTYVQRGMGGADEQYRPMEDLIRKRFLPCIMGRPTRDIGEDERGVYALPCRMGGLGVKNLMETAKPSHEEAKEATNFLVESLLGSRQWRSSKHGEHCKRS